MISALLFDLDDTLLTNDMKRFLPAYLTLLGEHLSFLAPKDEIASQVMAGSLAMIQNTDPTRTLQQVFAETFYPHYGVTEDDLQTKIDQFYSDVFPGLRHFTAEREGADQLVRAAFADGMEVVIATSPLFPRTAIEQRLAWAGLPVERNDYALITSYETFHFAKPQLAYYAEILARLGKHPHEAAMIGNDPTDDLSPAQSMGLAVFHLDEAPEAYPGGSFTDAAAWLKNAHTQTQPGAAGHPEVILARLRGHLSALLSILNGVHESAWKHTPKRNAWSLNQIVCHLRDVEREVYLPRIHTFLTQDEPHISAIETDLWAEERDYAKQSGVEAAAAFVQSRLQVIAEIENLTPEQWDRPARHSILGPTTLAEILKIATDHDLLHLEQIRSNLASAPSR